MSLFLAAATIGRPVCYTLYSTGGCLLLKSIACTLVQTGRFLAATGYVAPLVVVCISLVVLWLFLTLFACLQVTRLLSSRAALL